MLETQVLKDKGIKIVNTTALNDGQQSKKDKIGEGGQAKVFKVINKLN